MASLGVRSAIRNGSSLLAGEFVAQLVRLVFGLILAKTFAPADFGAFAVGASIGALLVVVSDLGMSKLVYIDAARPDRRAATIGAAMILRALSLPAAVILCIVVIRMLGYDTSIAWIASVYAISIQLMSMNDLFNNAFKANGHSVIILRGQLLNAACTALLIIGIVTANVNALVLVFLLCGKSLIVVSYSTSLAVLRYHPTNPGLVRMIEMLQRSRVLAASVGLITIYTTLDSILLSKMVGIDSAGIYRAASQLASPFALIGTVFVGAVFPLLARSYFQNASESERHTSVIYRLSARYLMILGGIVFSGIGYASPEIIHYVYGAAYALSAPCLQILILTQVIVYQSVIAADTLLANDKRSYLLRQTGLTLVVNIVANLMLIPYLAEVGAAIAMALSQATGAVYLWYALGEEGFDIRATYSLVPRVIVSSLAYGAGFYSIKQESFALAVAAGVVMYSGTLFLLRVALPSDIRSLQRAIAGASQL